MKQYFRFMAGKTGRALRFLVGLIVAAWGYNSFIYPANGLVIMIGVVYAILAAANVSLFAVAMGYPVTGQDIVADEEAELSKVKAPVYSRRHLHIVRIITLHRDQLRAGTRAFFAAAGAPRRQMQNIRMS